MHRDVEASRMLNKTFMGGGLNLAVSDAAELGDSRFRDNSTGSGSSTSITSGDTLKGFSDPVFSKAHSPEGEESLSKHFSELISSQQSAVSSQQSAVSSQQSEVGSRQNAIWVH